MQGHAWTFGNAITAMQILPLEAAASRDRRHVLAGADPTLIERLSAGDFIVAGTDFGHGDATAAHARALRGAGIAAVIARSFAPSFLQAALDVGFPALIVEETGAIKNEDRLRVDIEGHKVANLSSGDRYVIRNLYGESLDIVRAGGRAQYEALKLRAG